MNSTTRVCLPVTKDLKKKRVGRGSPLLALKLIAFACARGAAVVSVSVRRD
jgi:hypothetical protein